MKKEIYEIYQGEDFDITLTATDSYGVVADIRDIDFSIAFVLSSSNKTIVSTQSGLSVTRPDRATVKLSVPHTVTREMPAGEYVVSFLLEKLGKRVIEELYLLRVKNSVSGRV